MRLELLPDSDGYSFRYSNEYTKENQLLGGLAARRFDLYYTTFKVDVRFTLSKDNFDYLCSFLDEYEENVEWFDIVLITEPKNIEYALRNHKAQITPGSVNLGGVAGHRFVVTMELECYVDDPVPTSKPYDVQLNENLNVSAEFVFGAMKITLHETNFYETMQTLAGVPFIELRETLRSYQYGLDDGSGDRSEPIDVSANIQTITLRNVLRSYSNWPKEPIAMTASLPFIELIGADFTYQNYRETIQVSGNFVSGTLS